MNPQKTQIQGRAPKREQRAKSQTEKPRKWYTRMKFETIERRATATFRIGLKLLAGTAIVFLVIKLFQELNNDNYMTRPFPVPEVFSKDGVNGYWQVSWRIK